MNEYQDSFQQNVIDIAYLSHKNKNTQLKLVCCHRVCSIMLRHAGYAHISNICRYIVFEDVKECHIWEVRSSFLKINQKRCVSSVHSSFIKVSQRIITRQAETEANTGLLSLGAQRREAVIFCSSIASAKDSFVVIATDVHFYPSSDRLRRWD